LCVSQFLLATPSGVAGSAIFSADHFPPESVGGKDQVLTCKKCNNDAGFYEAELLKTLNLGTVLDQRYNSLFPKTWVQHAGTDRSFPVTITKPENKTSINFHPEAKKHNKALREFLTDLHAGKIEKLSILIPRPDEAKIGRATLKIAYLIGLIHWGYEFVFSNHGQLIRQVLQNRLEYPVRTPTFWFPAANSQVRRGISLLRLNGEKKAFVAAFDLKTDHEHLVAGIFLPKPGPDGWQELADLAPFILAEIPTAFECIALPPTPSLNGYSKAWGIMP